MTHCGIGLVDISWHGQASLRDWLGGVRTRSKGGTFEKGEVSVLIIRK